MLKIYIYFKLKAIIKPSQTKRWRKFCDVNMHVILIKLSSENVCINRCTHTEVLQSKKIQIGAYSIFHGRQQAIIDRPHIHS